MRQALGPGALGRPGGSGWRGRWERGSGWGRHVNSRTFHFNVWQNSLQIKKKKKIIWKHTRVERQSYLSIIISTVMVGTEVPTIPYQLLSLHCLGLCYSSVDLRPTVWASLGPTESGSTFSQSRWVIHVHLKGLRSISQLNQKSNLRK